MICLGEADAVVDRTNRVSDLEAEIPKEVEHLFNDLLAARQDLAGNQEQQIEHSQEVHRFMRDKFSNRDLYSWMVGQVSGHSLP